MMMTVCNNYKCLLEVTSIREAMHLTCVKTYTFNKIRRLHTGCDVAQI